MQTQKCISLSSICGNFKRKNVAIEYHDEVNITKITYEELQITRVRIKEIFNEISGSQFVAIDLEVPGYCIPSLILGIISSGRGFVNLSHSTSQDLYSRMQISLLFSQRSSISNTELLHRININGQSIQLFKLKTTYDASEFQEDSFAYAISTSGTTGVPKIVRVPHESIVPNIFDLRKIFSITQCDKIAQLTSLTFDPSIVEIFLGLSSSCTLFMASEELKKNPRKLLQIMHRSEVSIFQTTPSLLFGKFSKHDLKETILGQESFLRSLVLGGEPFPKWEAIKNIKHEKNQTKIYNIYGITEVSCWSSIEEVKEENKCYISNGFLGKPLSQTFFEIRSEEGKIVESEGAGILFIGSNKRICQIDEEKVNLSSVPTFRNTGDKVKIDNKGQIFYKGRHNKIIKRFGNRVDLSKLENAIKKINLIECCHIFWDEKNHKLHACVSKASDIEGDFQNIKTYLMDGLKYLPAFYQPDEIHLIDEFPLTSNGKICFQSLKKICIQNMRSTELSSQNIRIVFQNSWRLSAGSCESGFVKSGGTSVAALQIVNSLSEKFNLEFPKLIGMLLKDADFDECFAYVESEIRSRKLNEESRKKPEFDMNISDSASKKRTKIGEVKRAKLSNSYEKFIDTCSWQKCRGFQTGEDKIGNYKIIKLHKGMKLSFLRSFDLRKCVDASPTVFQYSSGKVFATVGSHSGLISTVELNSTENYFVELPDRIEASILVFDNFRAVVGCYDGNIYCLNLRTGEIFWKIQTGDVVKCTAVTCFENKNIFVGSYDRHMYCLSLKTGTELWKTKASEGSISATARLHFETRTLFFGTLDGSCLALDQVSGEIKWRQTLSDPIFSAPAILETGNVVFANVSGKCICFDIKTGQKLWTYIINGNIFSHLVFVKSSGLNHQSLVFASRNRTLYYLECNLKPKLKYSTTTESSIIATPWFEDEIIIIACIDGTLQIINSSTGEIVTSHKLDGDIYSSPVLHEDLVIVGCRDNKLYIFKLSD